MDEGMPLQKMMGSCKSSPSTKMEKNEPFLTMIKFSIPKDLSCTIIKVENLTTVCLNPSHTALRDSSLLDLTTLECRSTALFPFTPPLIPTEH